MTANAPKPSILLRFPSEIRNKIYRFLLSNSFPIRIRSPRLKPKDAITALYEMLYNPPDSGAGILYLNRQIHREALAIFLQSNTFSVGTDSQSRRDLKTFLKYIPHEKLAEVRKMEIKVKLCRAYSKISVPRRWDEEESSAPYRPVARRWDYSSHTRLPGLYLGTAADTQAFLNMYTTIGLNFTGLQELTVNAVFNTDRDDDKFIAPNLGIAKDATVNTVFGLFGLFGYLRGEMGIRKVRFLSTARGAREDAMRARQPFLDAVVESVLPVLESVNGSNKIVWRKEPSLEPNTRLWSCPTDPDLFEIAVEFGL